MPLYRDLDTEAITDVPSNIGEHRVLGARLVPYDPETGEYEEEKVVRSDATHSTEKVSKTAKPKAPSASKESATPEPPKETE